MHYTHTHSLHQLRTTNISAISNIRLEHARDNCQIDLKEY